ncbi:nuclear transport factor 2 family protein [Sinomicrobium weinanense]|nr:nuclear transport factor 2 family protein [Sinomicrobium weinanense]
MKQFCFLSLLIIFTTTPVLISCNNVEKKETTPGQAKSEQEFVNIMQRHLNAVTNRDIEALKSTMSPEGKMQLILPGSEIIYSVDGFMDYHKKWFSDSAWTFEAKILNTRIGNKIGMAVAEIMYKEPEREGKPYYNRMIVSYDLEKIDGTWYVIKDHASSVEKSTDKE